MANPKILEFRTSVQQSWGIFVLMSIGFLTAPLWMYLSIFKSSPRDPIGPKVVLIGVLSIGMIATGKLLSGWLRDIWYLQIHGSILTGKTLFGMKRQISIDDVKSFKIDRFAHTGILRTHSGKRFGIASNIDYQGYILDYILLRLPADAEVDNKGIQKLRNNANAWFYARRYPYSTDYLLDYQIWLEGVVRHQKHELIQKGILDRNRSYEEQRPFFRPGR